MPPARPLYAGEPTFERQCSHSWPGARRHLGWSTPLAEAVLVVEAAGAFVDRPELLPYRNLRPGVRLGLEGRVHGG